MAEWRSGRAAEWQSGRGSLARRVLQSQGDSRFSFPLLFPAFPSLIHFHLSSELPRVPRLHSNHLFVFCFTLSSTVPGHLLDYVVCAVGLVCVIIGLLVYKYRRELNTVPGHLRDIWCHVVCLCLTGLLCTVYNHSRSVSPTQYSIQISKGCISLALVPAPTFQIRLPTLLLLMQLLSHTNNYPWRIQRDALFRHNLYGLLSTKYGYNNIRGVTLSTACAAVGISDKRHTSIHEMRFSAYGRSTSSHGTAQIV